MASDVPLKKMGGMERGDMLLGQLPNDVKTLPRTLERTFQLIAMIFSFFDIHMRNAENRDKHCILSSSTAFDFERRVILFKIFDRIFCPLSLLKNI